MKLVVGIIIVVASIICLYFSMEKSIKKQIEQLNKNYGEKPDNKKINMEFIKKLFIEKSNFEKDNDFIDDLTWNDLDMDQVYKRIDYSKTTLGESYLYYKLRKVNCDKKEINEIEKIVDIVFDNEKLRNKIQRNLLSIGKINNENFIQFIYNPKFIKMANFYKYPLCLLGFMLSLILIIFNSNIGILLSIIFLVNNIILAQAAKTNNQDNYDTMTYLLKNLLACKNLNKIKDKEFNIVSEEIDKIISSCKEINKIEKYGKFISKSNNNGIMSDLEFFSEYFKMFFFVDIFIYQRITNILEKNREQLFLAYDLIGRLDYAISIAYYRKSINNYAIPEFIEGEEIEMLDLYHPLIDDPISNSINIEKNIILTGSNASGKSTFIKAVAINIILAQSINTALCSKYKCGFSKVITSMAIKDDIINGDSYFIAELKSLKRLVDSLNSKVRVVAFIDEILKGTNTIERISASAALLNYVKGTKAKVLVATHDIELTQMLTTGYDNYHFRETVTDEGVEFNYKLHKGPSKTRNAINLLRTLGFDYKLVDSANDICEEFISNRKWRML